MNDSTSTSLAKLYFNGLETFNALHEAELRPVVTFSSLVQTAMDPIDLKNVAILAQINGSITYRKQYRYVLETLSLGYSGRVAAASSQASVTQRDGESFSLRIETSSNQNDDNAQVMLNMLGDKCQSALAKLQDRRWLHLHCFYNDTVLPLRLKREADGVYSAVCAKNSAEYQAICDINCEVFIH